MVAARQDSGVVAGLGRRTPPKVSHLLAVDLRHRILTGELAADQRLPPEAELAATFSVSKETLREALRILESQSLLEIRRGRGGGPVVRRPGIDAVSRYVALLLQLRRATFAQLEEARSLVELPAAEQFAVRATDADLAQLVALHETERAGAGDPLAFAAAVAEFDQSVTELSGNRSLGVVAGAFREVHAGQVFQLIASVDAARANRFARRVVVSHSAFLEAARRRDGDLAGQAWSDYLFTTSALADRRDRRRALIDVTPLWRAQVGSAEGRAQRRAAAVANEIRARIAEGKLAEGSRLPPLPELAAEFDVSRPTLREALRVLEMERLLDLAAGDRAGAMILTPSTLAAARLVGIALEGRNVTFADFYRGYRFVEPPIRELAVERMGARAVAALRRIEQELEACGGDSAAFIDAWQRGDAVVYAEIGNPAISLIGEITRWVADEVERIASGGGARQWLDELGRESLQLFHDFVEAAAHRDGVRARRIWSDYLDINSPFFERSEIANHPLTGLVGDGAFA